MFRHKYNIFKPLYRFIAAVLACVAAMGGQCQTTLTVPQCYDFDDMVGTLVPEGWTACGETRYTEYSVTAYYFTGSPSLYFIAPLHPGNALVMPPLDSSVAINDVLVEFDIASNYGSPAPFMVGTMSDPTDSNTFHPIDSVYAFCSQSIHCRISLATAPAADRYIAFRMAKNASCFVDNLSVVACGFDGLRLAYTDESQATVEWNAIGSPNITATVRRDDGSVVREYTGATSPLVIDGLRASTLYTVVLAAVCDDVTRCGGPASDSIRILTPHEGGDCLNAGNIYSDGVRIYHWFGDTSRDFTPHFVQPTPPIDFGPDSLQGRIAVNSDTSRRDPLTGGQLRTIPEWADYSVRLGGNTANMMKSDGVEYRLTVDTSSFRILTISYAIVTQYSKYEPSAPSFHIQILDEAGQVLDSLCSTEEWIAPYGASDTGWRYVEIGEFSSLAWKDWQSTGLDLEAYANQTITIRLMALECRQGGHWAYAYYTIDCHPRTAESDGCGSSDSATFHAPGGFAYEWFREGDTTALSTSRCLTVPADGSQYRCEVAHLSHSDCRFTLDAYAGTRTPVARMETRMENRDCGIDVHFENRSFVAAGDSPTNDGGSVETAFWDFGNGDTSHAYSPTRHFGLSGVYNVMLVAGLDGNTCTDTAWQQLTVTVPGQRLQFDTACTDFYWHGVTYTRSGIYSHTLPYPNQYGCDSVEVLQLTILQEHTIEVHDTVVVCPYHPFVYNDIDYGGPTDLDFMLQAANGCDSLVHVHLMARDSMFAPVEEYSFDSAEWHRDSVIAGCAPTSLFLRDSTDGAYAWEWIIRTPDTTFTATGREVEIGYDEGHDGMMSSATLIVTSGDGCLDTVTLRIYMFRSPEASFYWDPHIPARHDPQVQFFNQSAPDSLAYLWQIQRTEGGEYDTSTRFAPHYRWGDEGDDMSGDYEVALIAYWTHPYEDTVMVCTDTARQTITITNDYLQFPNLVTPNGDGTNDVWKIVNLVEYGNFPMNELWIYNAWGVLVYHAKNIVSDNQFWDPEATHCPDGTYFYRFSAISEYGRVKHNGLIEVIRE